MKQKRRDQWDKAISAAKGELGGKTPRVPLEEDADAICENFITEDEEQGFNEIASFLENRANSVWFNDHIVPQESHENQGVSTEEDDGNLYCIMKEMSSYDTWKPLYVRQPLDANTGQEIRLQDYPPQSLHATEEARSQAAQRRYTPKKIASIEFSVARLVARMFSKTGLCGYSEEDAKQFPDAVRPLVIKSQDELEVIGGVTRGCLNLTANDKPADYLVKKHKLNFIPKYHQDREGEFHLICQDLNTTIQNLFDARIRSPRDQPFPNLIAQICNQLLTSTAPPDIRTYNILLTESSRLKHNTLFNITVSSLRTSYMRPNELTHYAILSHYTQTNNPENFTKELALMRAKFGGLMLAKPDINITARGAARLIRVEGKKDKVIQLPTPSSMVFSALISGVLKFAGFNTATQLCSTMGREGWGVDMATLTTFLKDCTERGDWASGVQVWNTMKTLDKNAREKSLEGKLDHKSYFWMLALCKVCEMPDQRLAIDVYNEAKKRNRGPWHIDTRLKRYMEKWEKRIIELPDSQPFAEVSNVDGEQEEVDVRVEDRTGATAGPVIQKPQSETRDATASQGEVQATKSWVLLFGDDRALNTVARA